MSKGVIDAGELFSFVIYSGFIGGTIGGLANVFTELQKFIGATEELFDIFNEEEEKVTEIKTVSEKDALNGRIVFKNLSFRYPSRPDEEVLSNINLTIPEDQMVAIVGSSGAGKSTIASLILRLHNPTSERYCLTTGTAWIFHCLLLETRSLLFPRMSFSLVDLSGKIYHTVVPTATDDEIVEAAKRQMQWSLSTDFPGN